MAQRGSFRRHLILLLLVSSHSKGRSQGQELPVLTEALPLALRAASALAGADPPQFLFPEARAYLLVQGGGGP